MAKTQKDYDKELEILKLQAQFGDTNTAGFDVAKLHSSYWMGELPSRVSDIDLISLIQFRRAVAKFVKISAMSGGADNPGKIKVKFNTQDHSFTNSEDLVVISSDIRNSEFDAAVGLALHETNHILYTEPVHIVCELPMSLRENARKLNIPFIINDVVNPIRNFIEDRRIDKLGWEASPGYRPYYKAVYDKYFGNKLITTALKSSYKREIKIDSYMFRLINIINPASDLDALPGLRKLRSLLHLDYIGRLKGNEDSVTLAIKVSDMMLQYIVDNIDESELSNDGANSEQNNEESENNQSKEQPQNSNEESDDNSDMVNVPSGNNTKPDVNKDNADSNESDDNESSDAGDNKDNTDSNESDDNESSDAGDNKDNTDSKEADAKDNKKGNDKSNTGSEGSDDTTKKETPKDITLKQKKQVENAIDDQIDYLNGTVNKKIILKHQASLINNIDNPTTELKMVEGMNVIVINNLTNELLKELPIYNSSYGHYESDHINKGIILGRLLAKKLQIRTETKLTKSKRKLSGKIDKRMLYNLGMGDTSIFERTDVDEYGDAIVHISVDASSSMSGNKWNTTMTALTAIAYAADKTENLDVVISFRATIKTGEAKSKRNGFYSTEKYAPLIVVAYDSRKDKINKVKTMFSKIEPTGLTPEGLCFEATMKTMIASSRDKIGYFINFSDGEPNLGNIVTGMSAIEITRRSVKKIKNHGIKVLSFFITSNEIKQANIQLEENFKYMYGNDAKFIKVIDLIPLTNELNKMFLTKK